MTQQLGRRGEALAAAYLQGRGYTIVTTNWRWAQGELDIVARQGETVVFVEVRARHASTTETAFASINPRKQARMHSAVQAYLSAHTLDDALWRIDVIAVAVPRTGQPIIEHVEDALDW